MMASAALLQKYSLLLQLTQADEVALQICTYFNEARLALILKLVSYCCTRFQCMTDLFLYQLSIPSLN